MGRDSGPEFLPVRVVEDLHSTVEDVTERGFRVGLHWSNVPAVSEADAYALVCRQQMLSEQHDEAQREWRRAQEVWHRERAAAYRTAMAAAMPADGGVVTPRQVAQAQLAGTRAMVVWERHNRPEAVGLSAAVATDPEQVEAMEAALGESSPVGRWATVGV